MRLVFVSAYAMPEGFRPTDGGKEMPGWMKVDVEVGFVFFLSPAHFYFNCSCCFDCLLFSLSCSTEL